MSESEPEHDYVDELDTAADQLVTARHALETGREQTGAAALSEVRETIAETIRDIDGGSGENTPLWELTESDIEDYVGCELRDMAITALGSAVVMVFERDDGSLHGFKLTPRENVRVCNIEVADE